MPKLLFSTIKCSFFKKKWKSRPDLVCVYSTAPYMQTLPTHQDPMVQSEEFTCAAKMSRFGYLNVFIKNPCWRAPTYFLFRSSGSLIEAGIAMWSIGGGNMEPGVLHSVCVQLSHLETLLAFAYTTTCQSSSLVMWYAALFIRPNYLTYPCIMPYVGNHT